MKVTLFFCAGNFAETLGIHRVSDMDGVGRRMPLSTIAFSVAALGMMGAPLTAGAVSKAWLSDGAKAAGMDWVVWVLWTSSLLNAAYFLPVRDLGARLRSGSLTSVQLTQGCLDRLQRIGPRYNAVVTVERR